MKEDFLVRARKTAERAVAGMEDSPLKVAAFQTILGKLLADPEAEGGTKSPVAGRRSPIEQPKTLTGRVLAIASEGFFGEQRTLGEVRTALSSRGWHYPVTTLSGAMQGLVRQRQLRRERVFADNKQVWRYSNP